MIKILDASQRCFIFTLTGLQEPCLSSIGIMGIALVLVGAASLDGFFPLNSIVAYSMIGVGSLIITAVLLKNVSCLQR